VALRRQLIAAQLGFLIGAVSCATPPERAPTPVVPPPLPPAQAAQADPAAVHSSVLTADDARRALIAFVG
jgi:hypothetical protein